MRLRKLSIALAASAIGVAALGAIPAMGADHRDAPLTKAAPASDINDMYLFKGASGNPVLLMTINPLTSPADTGNLRLDPSTLYEFKIDTNGDAAPDQAIKIQASGTGAVQDFTVRVGSGVDAVTNDPLGSVVLTGGKTSTGSGVTVNTTTAGHKIFIGSRDDPFFFDLAAFQAGLAFTNPGVDTFKGTNITAIVIELPNTPTAALGIWGTTSKKNNLDVWVQLERMGRPAIATVFIPADQKDAFNNNTPDRDVAIYTDEVKAALNSLGSPATDALAGLLLPDILTANFGMGIGFLNGRDLDDDVIDIELQAITGNTAASDAVPANDKAFLAAFPYLAAPNGAAGAPAAPNTGSGILAQDGGNDFSWTLPAGLIAASILLGAAGFTARRRSEKQV